MSQKWNLRIVLGLVALNLIAVASFVSFNRSNNEHVSQPVSTGNPSEVNSIELATAIIREIQKESTSKLPVTVAEPESNVTAEQVTRFREAQRIFASAKANVSQRALEIAGGETWQKVQALVAAAEAIPLDSEKRPRDIEKYVSFTE